MKKKKSTKDQTSLESTFFTSFVGEYIVIICKILGEHGSGLKLPVTVTGYLLDIDDDFYYLSDDGINVTRAVRKTEILTVEVHDEKTPEQEILENAKPPAKDEDYN